MAQLQGWHVDPWLRHQPRYFSDGQPTDLVRDGAQESTDPPPPVPALVADPPPATLTHEDEVPQHVFEGVDFERTWGGSQGYDQGRDPSTGENWVERLIIPVFSFLRPSRRGQALPQICVLGAPGLAGHHPPRAALGDTTAVASPGVGETLWTKLLGPQTSFTPTVGATRSPSVMATVRTVGPDHPQWWPIKPVEANADAHMWHRSR